VKVDVSHPEKNVALLHIEVDTEQIGRVRDNVYRRLVRRYNVPGFRKGKAPPLILERYLGRDAFDREVLDDLLDETYREAVDQAGLVPVSPPEVDLKTWERGEPLVYEAKMTTRPEVALGQYTGLEVPRDKPVVGAVEVQLEIEVLRQQRSELVEAPEDMPLAKGSIAIIDFAGSDGEEPVEGTTAENYSLEIGSGQFVPGFEEQLVGAKVGEQRDVRVTFPEDAGEQVAGKDVTFKVAVRGHRQRKLPEADDEFAVAVAPHIGVKITEGQVFGLADLKDELRRKLQARADSQALSAYSTRILSLVVGNAEVDIPEVMISKRAEAIREDFKDTLRRRGLTLEGYLSTSGETEETMGKASHERAARELRRDLVIEAVALKEGITAGEQEVDERVRTLALVYGQDPVALRAALEAKGQIGNVREEIVTGKTIDYLVGAQTPVEMPAAEEAASPKPKRQRRRPAKAKVDAAVAVDGPEAAEAPEAAQNNTQPPGVGIDQSGKEAPPKRTRRAKKGD